MRKLLLLFLVFIFCQTRGQDPRGDWNGYFQATGKPGGIIVEMHILAGGRGINSTGEFIYRWTDKKFIAFPVEVSFLNPARTDSISIAVGGSRDSGNLPAAALTIGANMVFNATMTSGITGIDIASKWANPGGSNSVQAGYPNPSDVTSADLKLRRSPIATEFLASYINAAVSEWRIQLTNEKPLAYAQRMKRTDSVVHFKTAYYYQYLHSIKSSAIKYDVATDSFTITLENCAPVKYKVEARYASCFQDALLSQVVDKNYVVDWDAATNTPSLRGFEFDALCPSKRRYKMP